MWLYEAHQGDGIYGEEYRLPYHDLVCETCGDVDWEIGEFKSVSDTLEYMSDQIAILPGDGGYYLDAILENLNSLFNENVTEEEARDIILKDRAKWE